jgi:hypothetical protein
MRATRTKMKAALKSLRKSYVLLEFYLRYYNTLGMIFIGSSLAYLGVLFSIASGIDVAFQLKFGYGTLGVVVGLIMVVAGRSLRAGSKETLAALEKERRNGLRT